MSDVVAIMRSTVIAQLEPFTEPGELTAVLQHLDAVPHDGDDAHYIAVAVEVVRAALEAAVTPRLNALRSSAAAAVASVELLEEHMHRQARELEHFRRMRTPKTIH